MGLAVYPWQEDLARELNDARANLPNGLLVYGPKLFCQHPAKDGTPCGECKGCKMAQAGTHPDLRYVMSEAEALPRGIAFEPPANASKDRKIYREILIHQPLIGGNGLSGQTTDIKIHTDHLVKTREKMNKLLSERTGQPIEKIMQDTERDNYMTAEEALKYGLIDEILEKRI